MRIRLYLEEVRDIEETACRKVVTPGKSDLNYHLAFQCIVAQQYLCQYVLDKYM